MDTARGNIKGEFDGLVSDDSETDYVLKNIAKCAGITEDFKTESYSDADKLSTRKKKRKLTLSDAMASYETDEMEDFQNSNISKFDDNSEEEPPDEDSDIPVCWSRKQLQSFQEKYIYLITKKGKLGCSICAQVTNLGSETGKFYHVSKQWRNSDVKCNGQSKKTKQASLRKKLSEHFSSSSHMKALLIVQGRETEMRNGIDMSDFDADMSFQNFIQVDSQSDIKETPANTNTQTTSMSTSPLPEERKFQRKRPTKQQFLNYMRKQRAEDDEYDAIGKIVAAKIRRFPKCQKLIAERLLHELLYQGQVSGLTTGSIIYTPSNKVVAAALDTKNISSEQS